MDNKYCQPEKFGYRFLAAFYGSIVFHLSLFLTNGGTYLLSEKQNLSIAFFSVHSIL